MTNAFNNDPSQNPAQNNPPQNPSLNNPAFNNPVHFQAQPVMPDAVSTYGQVPAATTAYHPAPAVTAHSSKHNGAPLWVVAVLCALFIGVIVYQETQITQLSSQLKDTQAKAQQTNAELSSMKIRLTAANEKTEKALAEVNRTRNLRWMCDLPLVGELICPAESGSKSNTGNSL